MNIMPVFAMIEFDGFDEIMIIPKIKLFREVEETEYETESYMGLNIYFLCFKISIYSPFLEYVYDKIKEAITK